MPYDKTINILCFQAMKGFVATPELFWTHLRAHLSNAMREAELGQKAPNPRVVDLASKRLTSLLDHQRPGRPLVLNFGSCT